MKRKIVALALASGFAGVALASSIVTGDLLAIDQTAGTSQLGALFIVDQNSGDRILFSDFGNSSQGDTGVDPNSVAWMPAALLGLLAPAETLVTDGSAGTNGQGALFEVDPTTGNRTLLSDFGNSAQGTVGQDPSGVLVISPGLLNWSGVLVIDPMAGTNGQGGLFSVNSSGDRTLITDFGDSTGPQGQYPDSMAYFPGLLGILGNTVLVADGSAGTNSQGELFTVDPATGTRAVLSDFGNGAQGWVDPDPLSTPMSVTVSPSGQIFVLVQELILGGGGEVIQVDPSSGIRTLVTDFNDSCGGTAAVAPTGIAWLPSSGTLGITDADAGAEGNGTLFTVNPSSGACTVLSDFGNTGQGALGNEPSGLGVAE
jgi:hypothetical protein